MRATWRLVALGTASAVVYGAGFTLLYPVTGFPGLPVQIPQAAPGMARAAGLVIAWLLLFALYYAAYRLSPGAAERRHVLIVMGFAVVFGALMVATYPISSTDVFDYVARAHFIVDRGGNPLLVSPASMPDQYPFFHYVTSVGNASPYGPVWQDIGAGVARVAGGNPTLNVVGMKIVDMGAYLLGMPLVYRALQRFRPGHALRGLLLYAWCPAALFEFGSSGHNDAVLVLGLVLAAHLLLSGRCGWAMVAVMAASLVKFSPLVILPLFALATLCMPRHPMAKLRAALGGVAGAALLTAVAYIPYGVAGFRATVATLFSRGDLRANSLAWGLGGIAHDALGWDDARVARWVLRLGLVVVAAALVWALARIGLRRNAAPQEVAHAVLQGSYVVLFALLLTAVPFFWPWYILWLVPFAALLPEAGAAATFTAFACGGFAIPLAWAYYTQVFRSGFQAAMIAVAFGPALVAAAWAALSARRLGGGRLGPGAQAPC